MYCQKHSVLFPMSERERMLFARRQLQTTKWKNTKINVRLLEEFQARFDHFQELKPCFAFLVNQFDVNVVGSDITDEGKTSSCSNCLIVRDKGHSVVHCFVTAL